MTWKNVLVIGGSGKTGRRVVERLTARGVPVTAVSRSSMTPFDWSNRETWAAALVGVDAVYVTYQPDLAVPAAPDDIRALLALAVAAGVQRVVLLSGRGEVEAQRCEDIVQQSGIDWSIVRASWFNQNFDESFFLEPILSGVVALPVGDVLEPFIDADDIADVVVAALLDNRHVGQVYEVTGTRLMTFRDAVHEIAAASGRDIQYVPISAAQYNAAMVEMGLSEDYIWLVNYLFTNVLDGRNAYLTDGVQRALGRQPRDFAAYARDAAATGVWDGQPA